MKKGMITILGLLVAICGLVSSSYGQEIDIKISRENDGKKEVFEKSYNSQEELESDEEFKEFIGDDDKFQFYFGGDDADTKTRIFRFDDEVSSDRDQRFHYYSFGEGDFEFDFRDDIDVEELLEELEELDVDDRMISRFHRRFDRRASQSKVRFEELSASEMKKMVGRQKLGAGDVSLRSAADKREFRIRAELPGEGSLTVRLLDSEQQEIQKRSYPEISDVYIEKFDVRNLEDGTYFVELNFEGKVYVEKMILE